MSKGKGSKRGQLGMLAQVQKLQDDLARTQAALSDETVEATAGGGVVRVVMSGTQVCKAMVIEPQLLEEGDVEMLQDLLLLAVNQAIQDSQALAARKLGPLTGGLGLPGIGG
jgi:DNA-binding YbaB/EbfC family protein